MKKNLHQVRRDCAEQMLKMYYEANAGHVGASLSCLEILVELCFSRMRPEDYVLLSKGHAAAALYTSLALSGRLPEGALETFYKDGTRLAAHPPCSRTYPSIPFGTGSLGHGLSLATGLVYSQRFTKRSFRVFAVLSDGDCNEGSTWEAALFASHHRLTNLTVIVDRNRLQGIGRSDDILQLEPLEEKWRSFGFATFISDNGNDFSSLKLALDEADQAPEGPRCVIARTTKGHGVPFMADRMEWHYLPMSEDQYFEALTATRAIAFSRAS